MRSDYGLACLICYYYLPLAVSQQQQGLFNIPILGELMNFGQQFGQINEFASNFQNIQQNFQQLTDPQTFFASRQQASRPVLNLGSPQQQQNQLFPEIQLQQQQLPPQLLTAQGVQSLPIRQPTSLFDKVNSQTDQLKPIVPVIQTGPESNVRAAVIQAPPQTQAAAPQAAGGLLANTPLGKAFQLPQQWDQFVRSDNFGIAKGQGCIPFLGEVVNVLFGRCQEAIDNRQWHSWSSHLNSAISQGKLDVLAAAKETCHLQAERQHCRELVDKVSQCDILGSVSTATALEQARTRCDKLTLLSLQPARQPNQLVNQIGSFLGSEVAGALLQNIFKG